MTMSSTSALRPLFAAAASLAFAACSSGSSPSGATSTDTGASSEDSQGSGSDTAGGSDATDAIADAPPSCGFNVGDVLCDLDLQGYLRNDTSGLATSVDLTTFKVSDALASGSQPYAFVFNTAYW